MSQTVATRIAWLFVVMLAAVLFHSASAQPRGSVVYGILVLEDKLIVRSTDLTDQGFSQDLLVVVERPWKERPHAVFQTIEGKIALISTKLGNAVDNRDSLITLGMADQIAGTPPGILSIPALKANYAITSIVAINENKHLGLIAHFTDTPPYSVVTINTKNGKVKVLKKFQLSAQTRFGNFTRCPNNDIYATTLSPEGGVHLANLKLKQGRIVDQVKLLFNSSGLRDDIHSLACSQSNQLYALADPDYRGINALFEVDQGTGNMRFVSEFQVDEITFSDPLTPIPDAELPPN
ncbi:MAG: hypothetical protein OEU36_24100 [Gammaproteobacteria bacterium]|nr:hypothetical protein [Gammaproteobacteria bacterium]